MVNSNPSPNTSLNLNLFRQHDTISRLDTDMNLNFFFTGIVTGETEHGREYELFPLT